MEPLTRPAPVAGCSCADFLAALRTQFVLQIGGAVYLASRESRGHSDPNISSTLYGPKITFCPFCGTKL